MRNSLQPSSAAEISGGMMAIGKRAARCRHPEERLHAPQYQDTSDRLFSVRQRHRPKARATAWPHFREVRVDFEASREAPDPRPIRAPETCSCWSFRGKKFAETLDSPTAANWSSPPRAAGRLPTFRGCWSER